MKKLRIAILLLIAVLSQTPARAQSIRIAVISDPHYFDTSLLIQDGPAFQYYLASDRKLIKEGPAILTAAIDTILADGPDIVLVPGDLTKDGAFSSHSLMAAQLQILENAGIKVYVTCGNHDINNPRALAFDSATVIPVPGVGPAQFDSLYAAFGFAEAIARDSNSLSYVAEPFPGLRILAMDVCDYDDNYTLGHPVTGGRFRPATLQWALQQIADANAAGKRILGMMHHGLVEHFYGQATLFADYVVQDWDSVSNLLADAGLEVVFTGHFHAQDIVGKTTSAGNRIYDVETGSLVTWPCPVRFLDLNGNQLSVTGYPLENVNYNTGGLPFQDYAYNYLVNGMPLIIQTMLMQPPYNLPDSIAQLLEPALTASIVAHYAGDEANPPMQVQLAIFLLMSDPQTAYLGTVLDSLWNDPAPADWVTTLNLSVIARRDELPSDRSIRVYPNPTPDRLRVEGNTTILSYLLTDQSGKQVGAGQPSAPSFNLQTSGLKPGLYLLQLFTAQGLQQEKIVIRP